MSLQSAGEWHDDTLRGPGLFSRDFSQANKPKHPALMFLHTCTGTVHSIKIRDDGTIDGLRERVSRPVGYPQDALVSTFSSSPVDELPRKAIGKQTMRLDRTFGSGFATVGDRNVRVVADCRCGEQGKRSAPPQAPRYITLT